MNTIQFFQAVLNWLLADPSHLVVAASVIAAATPTPNPNTIGGKVYKILDTLALNVVHAKQTGVTPAEALMQVAQTLEQQKK